MSVSLVESVNDDTIESEENEVLALVTLDLLVMEVDVEDKLPTECEVLKVPEKEDLAAEGRAELPPMIGLIADIMSSRES